MWLLAGIGICVGGIYLILRDLFPYLKARSTGVAYTRGYKPRRVSREDEPGRYNTLCRDRTDGMIIGSLTILFGIGWPFVGPFALIMLLPIGAVMTAMSKRSKNTARGVSEECS